MRGKLGQLEQQQGVQHLSRPWKIHICKDRTLSYRTKGQPIFNGVALVVFSVETERQAEDLVTLVGSMQYQEHPQIPGKPWRKLFNGVAGEKQYLALEDLPEVTAYLADKYALLTGAA